MCEMCAHVLAGPPKQLRRLELHLWGWGISMALCNFLVCFLPLSAPLWSGVAKTLRSFTRAITVPAQGRAGRGRCGKAASGLLGWQGQEQELAGRPPSESGKEEKNP